MTDTLAALCAVTPPGAQSDDAAHKLLFFDDAMTLL
jgi:hypothetical protein